MVVPAPELVALLEALQAVRSKVVSWLPAQDGLVGRLPGGFRLLEPVPPSCDEVEEVVVAFGDADYLVVVRAEGQRSGAVVDEFSVGVLRYPRLKESLRVEDVLHGVPSRPSTPSMG